MVMDRFIDKIRAKSNIFYSLLYHAYKNIQNITVKVPRPLVAFMYSVRLLWHEFWYWLINKFYYEPLLRYRCSSAGKCLKTDGDIPLISGSGRIIIGDNVAIGNRGAWILSPNIFDCPELIIGSNTTINYEVGISVECRVEIGSNCIIAGETKIFDNNSHALHFSNKRKMTKDDIAPIKIEDNVWIGMRSLILKGVTIGYGAVVAAGSVVTKDVAPLTLVGGNPARHLKTIKELSGKS
jgi:carbonic anhydrase/acetyltransferase-like protein (isoleucine patch superfamily)